MRICIYHRVLFHDDDGVGDNGFHHIYYEIDEANGDGIRDASRDVDDDDNDHVLWIYTKVALTFILIFILVLILVLGLGWKIIIFGSKIWDCMPTLDNTD